MHDIPKILGNISFRTPDNFVDSKDLNSNPIQLPGRFFYLHSAIDLLLKITLLIIIIVVFVPLSPKMPAPGLDSSWALGLNQAVAQGLSFGKEIIFTLGPYSSIYTKAYHPATDLMMIGGSLYLACSYWLGIILLMHGRKWRWTLALGICLCGMIYARDSLFFSYPLIVGLVCFKTIDSKELIQNKWRTQGVIALLFTPFGLLPLIKGSMLILCSFISLLCCFFFTYYKKNTLALICLFSPLTTLLLFWLGSGQSLLNLPLYFMSSFSMASGFTEAMSTVGNNNEILLYLVSSSLILLTISWEKQRSKIPKLFLLYLFFVFLFLSFKTGFTRHFGHAYISGTSILLAALLLPYLFNSKKIIPVMLFSIVTSSYIDGHYTRISISNNFLSTYTSAWYGLKNRINDRKSLNENFGLMMHFLKEQISFPVLLGTTDIYSYSQAYLIASNLNWSPRPIFQSYSVFTAKHAEKNREHLLSAHRPDNIIFKIEPIDGRMPSIEDGASWPVLLSDYQPTHLVKDFIFLHKRNSEHSLFKPMRLLKDEVHVLGETVKVPDTDQPIFAELEIKPTLYGQLAIIFFKPSPLLITVELENGIKKQYRLNANMAKSGFLLSPLIESTNEFALLYQKKQLLEPKKIKFLSISTTPNNWHWSDNYTIHFKKLSILPNFTNKQL